MDLYLIRHGQTEENLQHILQGQMPGTLTQKGRVTMLETARALKEKDTSFDALLSSDLRRAEESAAFIAQQLGMEVEATPLLRERDWGKITGLPIAEARDRFRRDGRWEFPPSVETEEQMRQRARQFIHEIGERSMQKVLAVTHGLFARVLISEVMHCAMSEVTPLQNGEVRLVKW